MALTLHGMDHFTVLSGDLDRTRAFYELFGFVVGPRPNDLPGPGLWLYLAGAPRLHVIGPVATLPPARGMLDHMAFRGVGLRDAVATLDAHAITWRLERLAAPFAMWQLFFEDPFGARVEFDFDGAEAGPDNWRAQSQRP